MGRGCGGSWRLEPPGGARRPREAAAGAGSGGALGKAAAPGLAQTPAPPSPGTGGPPRPPRRRRGSPKQCARRREHIHRGVPAASGRRRLPAPGALAPHRRLTRLPGALGPARAHRPARAQTRLAGPPARPPRAPSPPPPPPPPPDAHPRPGLPGAERLLSARPPPRHTHTFSSFSELEHRSGREAAAAAEGGEGGGGRGWAWEEESGRRGRRPLLEGFPGLAAAAARLPVRLSPRSRSSCSRALGLARRLSGHGHPRRGGRGRVAEAQPGPPPTCSCRPAARAW